MHLDQVLGLTAGAVEDVVDMLGGTLTKVGDDEADVEAHRGRLDAGADAAFLLPGFRPVSGFRIAVQHRLVFKGAAGADVVGGLLDETLENMDTSNYRAFWH